MRTRQLTITASNTVSAQFQRPAGRDLRIQLAQAAGCGITGIGEGLAAAFQLSRIERFEAGLGHVDFAAHRSTAGQPLPCSRRDVANGAHICADVLASAAIAAGSTAHQMAVS